MEKKESVGDRTTQLIVKKREGGREKEREIERERERGRDRHMLRERSKSVQKRVFRMPAEIFTPAGASRSSEVSFKEIIVHSLSFRQLMRVFLPMASRNTDKIN